MFPELRVDQQERVVAELKTALAQVGLTAAVAQGQLDLSPGVLV
jgi:uncharacterized coiled-coil protein SlyX